MARSAVLNRFQDLWVGLAGVATSFPASGVRVVVAGGSRLCPPGWAGIVVVGTSGLATARFLRESLDGRPPSSAVEAGRWSGRHGVRVVAAAGYRRWPYSVAHLCVLTSTHLRGRGLAGAVASAAVAEALRNRLLPQWRARPEPSRRVARRLGFRELGAQVSLRIADHQGERQQPAATPA
ncbi:GNAT family N-acetyltransferase [Micromonospora cathayae]|uniref:GNAT family N-acetyltransferase n=1 Tax=Micromonospora cathayae TaxID=3028804 RepID=A0ABY7ZJN4_9ACTN|nr:GNAT family N-acetyltransferase [Micromonospora sp. HUAS 3]WDZ83098.1 GNAT family N-acetyltransferase [Micromonospora sp. HUAS 3]